MTYSQKRITTKEGNTFIRQRLFENIFPPYHRDRPFFLSPMDSTSDHRMVDVSRDVVDDKDYQRSDAIFEVKLVGLTGDSLVTLGNLTASMLGQELIEKSCQSLPSKQGQIFFGREKFMD